MLKLYEEDISLLINEKFLYGHCVFHDHNPTNLQVTHSSGKVGHMFIYDIKPLAILASNNRGSENWYMEIFIFAVYILEIINNQKSVNKNLSFIEKISFKLVSIIHIGTVYNIDYKLEKILELYFYNTFYNKQQKS